MTSLWRIMVACAAATLFSTIIANSATVIEHQHQFPLIQALDLTVRAAQPSDAKVMAEVLLDAFHDTPHIQYTYQYLDDYRHQTLSCLATGIHRFLETSHCFGHVGQIRTWSEGNSETVVSAALWSAPNNTSQLYPLSPREPSAVFSLTGNALNSSSDCPGPALNVTRALDFIKKINAEQKRLLDDVYGNQQLYLEAIGTLPEYQGHDIAGHLLREGLKFGTRSSPATVDTLQATLIATQAGEPLYLQNGYQSIENISISSIDGDQFFDFDVMVRPLRDNP